MDTNQTIVDASGRRKIGDVSIFDDPNRLNDPDVWEQQYDLLMDPKYKKNKRNFSNVVTGKPHEKNMIFMIPRERGKSYKSTILNCVNSNEEVQYCPISKGYSQQDVSSFTLGPIVGRGLCLVNAAFSVSICEHHLRGGKFDPKSKNFWRKFRSPERRVVRLDNVHMSVNNEVVIIREWLKQNMSLWFPQWELWRRAIAMCSRGDFHWCNELGDTLCYKLDDEYLDFVQWKKQCYIGPSYTLLPHTKVYQFLQKLYNAKIPIGLVHPKAITNMPENPFTVKKIRQIYDSPVWMCCQPFVVAGCLMCVPIDEVH